MKLKNNLLIAALFLLNNGAVAARPAISFTPRPLGCNSNIKNRSTFCTMRLAFLMLILSLGTRTAFAQNLVPFNPRYNQAIKGDMLLIGNNLLSNHVSNDYTGTKANNEINPIVNVDIDGDPSTFNSSSANLIISGSTCYKIRYAGLYWGAVVKGSSAISNVKFKVPNGSYTDLIGNEIYFQNSTDGKTNAFAYYADVTSLITPLTDPQGTYTVANVSTLTGNKPNVEGLSAGWSLFVVYEDPTMPSKYITSFDGYSIISSSQNLNIPVSGFKTIPVGPVNAKYAFSALEGDSPYTGDYLSINGTTISATNAAGTTIRPANNFFNSSVSYINTTTNTPELFTTRTPSSKNTLGFDAGILKVPNPGNTVIKNGDTSATIRLGSTLDIYYFYFNALAVDIIEPKIILTKEVKDDLGNDVGGADVTLGQQLNYILGFQNLGNDNADTFTIKDVLPINIIFNYPADLASLPAGITHTYNASTRTIVFTVPNSLIEINDPRYEIRIKVKVVSECNQLSDMCSNIIQNQAFATYKGIINTAQITDNPSLSSFTFCNLGTPSATNFLVGIDDCIFAKSEVLCSSSVVLTAANGYNTYSWSTSPTGLPIIGTNQTFTATQIGTYYVHDTAVAPCLSIDEIITVTPFGTTISNPVIPFADQVVTCPNDGKKLPNIFLCGANDARLIKTNISDGSTIVWEKLNDGSCAAVTNIDCANENLSCTWSQVGTGPDYNANAAGQYRITLNYPGGCFNRFYFNVYQNLLSPTVSTRDIICNSLGQITVGGVPSGYEYSIDGINYQASTVFSISVQNSYTVYIKQIGVISNPCIFTVPNVQIRKRDFTVSTFVTQPACNGDKGAIKLAANDVRGQYYYKIFQGATLVNQVGPIAASDYTFSNLNAGTLLSPITYTWEVSTEDGCLLTGTADLIEPEILSATAALTKPLTCTDGEITVYPVGGTPPFYYFVNSTTVFQNTPQISITTAGVYAITVVDSNNCTATASITVSATLAPVFTVAKTDVLCSNASNSGTISVNVSSPNGNSLRYSIDNGVTFFNSPVFTGLVTGNYNIVVEYTNGVSVCTTAPQAILITAPIAITGTATLTTPYTCSNSATITVSGVSGGTSPYEYSIDGVTFQSSPVFSGLVSGTYSITIKDSSSCTFVTNAITITSLKGPTDLLITATDLICPENVSHVNIMVVDGISPTRYRIIDAPPSYAVTTVPSPWNSDGEFKYLPKGFYTFEVKDRNDCVYQEVYFLDPIPPISVIGTLINNVKCYNTATGALKYDVFGFATTYSYTITGPVSGSGSNQSAPTITQNNLPAGDYTITVTDKKTGCTATATVTIAQPASPLLTTTTTTPITCLANGSVTLNASGGWGGYNYTLTPPSGPVVGPQASNIFTNLTLAGSYTIATSDANGCSVNATFTLNGATPPTAVIASTSDFCFNALNGASLSVTASGGVVPYEYSNNGGPFQASNLFSNLTPGTYTITVRDAYGCSVSLPTQTIAPQVSITTVLTKEFDCSTTPNAIITATIANGYSPFTYQVSYNGGVYSTAVAVVGTTFSHPAILAGTYLFQITDNKGCQSVSNTITIAPITTPSATVTTVNPSCNGGNNGSVQLIPSLGVGPYTYSFNGSAFTSTSLYTGLSAGISYPYQVKDNKSCVFSSTITLTQPSALAATTAVTPFSCSATNTKQSATITLTTTVGSGTAPYQYSFNGSGFTATNSITVNDNGSNQSIPYVVKDAQGCTVGGTITLLKLNPPTANTITHTLLSCTTTTSTVTVTPTAGTGVGSLTYAITAPLGSVSSNGTGIFTGLAAGTYIFKVTDANGCYYTQSHVVAPVTPIAVTGVKLSDVLCNGDTTGAIQFTVSGYSGAYTSSLTSGTGTLAQSGNTVNLTNLVSGSYTIQVTDSSTGCIANATVVINQPATALAFTAVATAINCNNDTSQITVTASGGTTNYTYAAVISGATAPIASAYGSSNIITVTTNAGANLNWDVYVKDANGCSLIHTITVASDAMPTISTPALASNQCTVSSGFTFTAIGTGIAPLSYSINGGSTYQSSPTFTVNTAGSYTVTIKDGNGCIANSSSPTQIYPVLLANALLTKDLTCSLPSDALITITVSGGNAPYTYQTKIGLGSFGVASAPFAGPSFTYNATTADTYQFLITDANGCTVQTNTISTTAIVPVTASYTTLDPNCNNNLDGAIQLTALTGVAPFMYSINGGTTFVASNVFGGLASGSYSYIVRDSKGCDASGTIVLTNPLPITVSIVSNPIVCNANTPGSFDVSITSGGIAPFTYNVYDNSFNLLTTYSETGASPTAVHSFNGLNFGDYYITVVDAKGCEFRSSKLRIETPPYLTVSGTVDSNNCATGVDITVTTSGGIGPYRYSIFGQAETIPMASNSYTFTGLLHGVTYFFQVKDVNNCISIFEFTTPLPPSTINISGTSTTNVTCNGSANGTLTFTVQNFDPSVTNIDYEIVNSLTLLPIVPAINGTLTGPLGGPVIGSITNLPPGNYVLKVREATGTNCSSAYTFSILQPIQVLNMAVTAEVNANCNSGSQLTLTATGGTAPYQFAAGAVGFVPVIGDYTTSNVLNLDDTIRTNWDIVVKDANGCEFRINKTITKDADPTLTAPALQCFAGSPLSITISGSGVGALTYSIGGAYQSSPTFAITTPGSYTLSIKDGNGCTASTLYLVQPQLALDVVLTKDLDCTASPNAVISLSANGGTAVYTSYEYSTNAGASYSLMASNVLTTATAGTYSFRVTDSQNCQALSTDVVVTAQTSPAFTFVQTNVSCHGSSDGTVVVSASNGIAPYQYSIDNGVSFQSSNVFSGLNPAGTYWLIVKDSKSCDSSPTAVTITEPTTVTGTAVLTQGLSCGSGNASQPALVTVTGNGGTGMYQYSFDGGLHYTATATYTTNVAGTVTAYIKDANGCISPIPATVNVPGLNPPTDLNFVSTAVSCLALTSDVTLTATNGTSALSYAILSPATATANLTGATTGIFLGLAPDTYLFEVTDANSCTYQESYTIAPVTNITVSGLLTSDVSCAGGSNGSVVFTVSNFATTYSYSINGVATAINQNTATISLSGLAIGNQKIEVTDDITGCVATATILVSESSALTLALASNTNANCNFGAQVSVSASGGTPNYTYAFVQDTLIPVASDYANSSSAIIDPTLNTQWDVYVKDAKGCTNKLDVTVATDPLPTITVPALASNQCNLTGALYDFTITTSTGIAPLSYSIGNGFQSSGTFTGLIPGTYAVTVKDGNGCIAVSGTSVTIYPSLDFTPTSTVLPSCANNDGVITVSPSGGSGTYSYSVVPNLGSMSIVSNVISGIPAGSYDITITDGITLCSKTTTVVLEAATPVNFTASDTVVHDVNCKGDSNGIITINLPASNNNPVYTYEITAGPILFAPQTSNIFIGLTAGTYDVKVNSGRGCSLTVPITVSEPLLGLTVSATAAVFGCALDNTINTAAITITEVGGTAGYNYSIDGINYFASNVFDITDNGAIQNVTVYVKDANGCLATNTVSINPLQKITATSITIVTPIDCNNSGAVSIGVTGGSGNFNYQLMPNGIPQLSNLFNIGTPGDYYFQVNDLNTGCYSVTAPFTVIPYNTIEVVSTATKPVVCFGDSNGELAINISGYSGTYNYTVLGSVPLLSGTANTAVNPFTIGGLSGGNYSIEVTETASPFCVGTSNVVTIASPAIPLSILASETANVTCANNQGTITAVASGGWGTYQYELTGSAIVGYSTNGTFTNLAAGTYTVNAKDSNGCIVASTGITLTVPTPINATVTPSTTLLSCFGDTNASITLSNVTGGQGSNYSYTLNRTLPTAFSSGPQSLATFGGLGAGAYTVTITDGYNCSFTSTAIIIAEPTKVVPNLVVATTQTCLTQTKITLSAIGGTAPYTYSADGIVYNATSFNSSVTFAVPTGTYHYYVKDLNGCVSYLSNDITIDPLPQLVINLNLTNAVINCNGDNTGVIVATAQGGLGNYVYTLQDASGNTIPAVQASPGVFTGLIAGVYNVKVTSGDCETTTTNNTISQPLTPLIAPYVATDVTCAGSNNGKIVISASGGTGIIKYAISPYLNQFFDTNIFYNLAPGNYDVVVQDVLGCYVKINFDINEPTPIRATMIPGLTMPEICFGDNDGAFSIDIVGGTMPYSVSLDQANGPFNIGTPTQTQFDFTGLAGGAHTVYIKDGNGCTLELSTPLPDAIKINPIAVVDYTCVNNAASNSVTVTVDASITNPADLDYSLDGLPYQASNVFTNLIPGTHAIEVRHTNGCIKKTTDFDIAQVDPLALILNDGGLNEIVAVATGGGGGYQYTLNGISQGNTSNFIIYESGDYTVTVTDANGCSATATRYFKYIDVCIPNYFTPNGDGVSDGWAPGCTINYKDLTFDIFDRYGRKVASYRLGQYWDGKYNGAELPSGDYWYVLKLNDLKDDREFVGHFTLYR